MLDTATTSGGSFYLFTDLEPGAYCVQHVVPVDYRCTEANAAGVDNAFDSDTLDIGGNLCKSDDPGQNPIILSSNESDRTRVTVELKREDGRAIHVRRRPPPSRASRSFTRRRASERSHPDNAQARIDALRRLRVEILCDEREIGAR